MTTETTSIKENQTLSDMLFPVEKVKMQDLTGIPANSDYEFAVVGEIEGEKRILNACSERYELIPNSEVFPQIRETLFNAGIEFKEKYKIVNNVQFYGDYIIDINSNIGNNINDKLKVLLRARRSYNGKTNYGMFFGLHREVCENGMLAPVEDASNLHIVGKHTKSINHSMEILFERLNIYIENLDYYKETFDQLADQKVLNPEDRVKQLLEACKIPEKKTEQVMEIVNFESQKLYNGQINDWLLYNGVNQLIHKGDNKKVLEQKEIYDNKAIEFLTA